MSSNLHLSDDFAERSRIIAEEAERNYKAVAEILAKYKEKPKCWCERVNLDYATFDKICGIKPNSFKFCPECGKKL
jgi:hypothetical protein